MRLLQSPFSYLPGRRADKLRSVAQPRSPKSYPPRRDRAPYIVLALFASALLAWVGCSGETRTDNSGSTQGATGSGGSGGSGGSSGAGPACGPATTLCGAVCVDTSIDPANCGGCDKACAAGEVCSAGSCGLACVGGTTKCGNACVNTQNDPTNCGGCGVPCAAGEVCSAGSCGFTCVGGTTKCGGACIDTQNDPANCGGCGVPCAAGEVCSAGACGFTCVGGTTKCGNACVNAQNDPANCGGCGAACAAGEVCSAGSCGLTCAGGTTKCGNACVDIKNDPVNCGACGNGCSAVNATPLCSNGACVAPICDAGFGNCDSNPATGCEANLKTDALHCGACGNACTGANGTPTCTNAACGLMCDAGFGNCDNNLANGCEVTLANNPAHCGACGNACSAVNATPVCANGACGAPICNAGFGDCDGNPATGCETDLGSNASNCGACGNTCAGGVSCTGGTCGVALQNQILFNGYYYATLDDVPPSAPINTWSDNCQQQFITLPQGWSLAPEDPAVVTNIIAVNVWSTHCILFSDGVSYGVQTYSAGANCGCSGNQCLEQSGNQYRATSCNRRILIRRPQ